jgi:hypothetical protein
LKILEEELFNQCKINEDDLKANSGTLLMVRRMEEKHIFIE